MTDRIRHYLGVPETYLHAAVQFLLLGAGCAGALKLFQSSFFNVFSLSMIGLFVAAGILVEASREWVHAILWSGMLVFGVVRPFGVEAFYIPSGSMEDTLQVDDHLMVNKAAYYFDRPERWEIVVFRPPHKDERKYIKRIVGMPGDTVTINPGKYIKINDRRFEQEKIEETAGGYIASEANHHIKYTTAGAMASQEGKKTVRVPETGSTVDLTETTPLERVMYKEFLSERSDDSIGWRGETLYRNNKPIKKITVKKPLYFVMGDHRTHSRDSRYWGFLPESRILGRPFLLYWPPERFQLL